MKDERGSATLFAALLIPVMCAGAFVLLAMAQQAIVHQQLRTAADLSALAAAQALGPNCERAADIAQAHGTDLISCESSGSHWTVGVSAASAPMMQRLIAILGRQSRDVVQFATAGYGDPASNT